MNGPLPVSGQNFCSPALNLELELGMLSIWRTASCCTTDWSMNWLKWPTSASRSTNENALKFGDAALKLSDTNNFPKPGKQQCNNLNHTLTNKYQWYQDTGWDSLVGLMMVVRLMLVQIGLNLCMPQAWRKARYSFHRLVVNSSTAFTSDPHPTLLST